MLISEKLVSMKKVVLEEFFNIQIIQHSESQLDFHLNLP